MNDFEEGSVVIVARTMQAGTIVYCDKDSVWVLLACGEFFVGPKRDVRHPQDQADLDAVVLNADKFEGR